ncbi:MAG: sialidase-1 [Saprospiraceae bacterium]|jgi:sialidase-1
MKSRYNVSIIFIVIILIALNSCKHDLKLEMELQDISPVFITGTDGYECFRIPAIVSLTNGDLLAFAEGRVGGCSDTGDIDLVMKRSMDLGSNWGPLQIIWNDSTNTCGNPAPVVDINTGDVHVLITWNLGEDHESEIIAGTSTDTRRVFHLLSKDEGSSWSTPKEITSTVKETSWTWYATGPGSGIQLSHSSNKGRLVIACDHIEAKSKKYYSHVIYSDDNGQSWELGGTTPQDQVNECEVAELTDGRLLLNMRNYDRNNKWRQIAYSADGGLTWKDQKYDAQLIEPICQASLQTITFENNNMLLFSNPASTEKRANMTLRVSYDQGESWADSITIFRGPSAYSDLVIDQNKQIGCLYEMGNKSPYEQIAFAKINLSSEN